MHAIYRRLNRSFHRLGSPKSFYQIAERLIPWLSVITLMLIGVGLYGGLVVAPGDYQQGESVRIIYVHVPSAWLSLFVYIVMALSGGILLIWHLKLAEVILIASAPIGASFTLIALVSGALWGKPMWGAWWVWDARLTSELILLFLYWAVIALHNAIEDKRSAGRAAALLALVGVVNIPIIHYSVEWWNTLHQGPTVTKFDAPSIHFSMLIPLLLMFLGFQCLYGLILLLRARCEILKRERKSRWVQELLGVQ